MESDGTLSVEECSVLERQNSRLVSDFVARQLEVNAKKNWDLFYKRNETRFFRDRHWTIREFRDLCLVEPNAKPSVLLEVGCGVGNFVFPLIEEDLNLYIYACDFSPRAVAFVKNNPLYDESKIKAFQADITTDEILEHVALESVDVITLIFVLSAIHPDKFISALKRLHAVLVPGGCILFRDYGLHDMAQFRFKPGNKIGENFYMRQDGTRSYYFSTAEVCKMFEAAGFKIASNSYIQRRTVNVKEGVDVGRIFVQGKFEKSAVDKASYAASLEAK